MQYWDMTIGEILDTLEQAAYQKREQAGLYKTILRTMVVAVGNQTFVMPRLIAQMIMEGGKNYPRYEQIVPPELLSDDDRQEVDSASASSQRLISPIEREGAGVKARIQQYAAMWNANVRKKRGLSE